MPPPAVAGGLAPGALLGIGLEGVAGVDTAGAGGPLSLGALRNAVLELRQLATSPAKEKKSKKEKKDKKRKKGSRGRSKDKGRDRSRRRRKKRSSGHSSSSSSRSSKSSTSSSGSSQDEHIRWSTSARSRKKEVTPRMLHAVEAHKFRKRGDVVQFAARHPGALSGYFLASVYGRLSKGVVRRQGDLQSVSVSQWAAAHSGLTDIRDLREAQTLSYVMDSVNRGELAQAMDVLAQRILALQLAKRKGGSWEKAETVELIPSSSALTASPMLSLGT